MPPVRLVVLASLLAAGLAAAAPVVQVPEGGRPVEVLAQGVVCGPVRNGWSLGPDGRSVHPPARPDDNARTQDLKVADTPAQCATSERIVTVIATGPLPRIDFSGTSFYPDEGRLELRGVGLLNVGVAWSGKPRGEPERPAMEGQDVCLSPSKPRGLADCAVPVPQGLPTDTSLYWIPPYGRVGPDVKTYDALGNLVDPESLRIRPGRTILTEPLVLSNGIDVSKGPGSVPVSHSEAIATADCGIARCEPAEGFISVRNVPGVDATVTLRARLVPRVYFSRADVLDQVITTTLSVLACPLTAVEGSVLRGAENSALVVRLDPVCAHDPRTLVWTVNGLRVRVERVVKLAEGTYVLLRTGGTSDQQVTITALTSRQDGTVVASETAKTLPLPVPRASLELPGLGSIDFIPTNRPAQVSMASNAGLGRFVLEPLPGAYSVTTRESVTLIQGEAAPGAFVALRFGYRLPTLPAELATTDLVLVDERFQRVVREASVPARIENLVEFVCADKDGKDQVLEPSRPHRIPYEMRNTCRVIVHRQRLKPEDGNQEVLLRISVTKPDGSVRGESGVEQRMFLRPQGEQRDIPVPGNMGQYDRITVQVSHVADESRYALSTTDRTGLPSAQWTAIVTGGLFRLYTTAAIPAGLYCVIEPTGQLAINFGVVSRLALLNNEGQERLLGIEAGLMGLGLVPQSGDIQFPPTLAVVLGLGLRVPIGPGAAVGAQAWLAYEFRGDIRRRTGGDPTLDPIVPSSKWSFIFGPSISVGNVGFNL